MNSSNPEISETLELFRKCTPLFDALGDPMRQQIIMLLGDHVHLNVNQIAERLPLSRPAISHHLKILREAGFVSVNRKGTENLYSLELEAPLQALKALIQNVEETCL